jgi:hypothetical protein
MTLAMPDPRVHRMADPVTRRRTGLMLGALFALAMVAVTLLGRPAGFFTSAELRHVSGLPIAPPQIQRRIAPPASDASDLQDQIQQLEQLLRGTPVQPSPAATR